MLVAKREEAGSAASPELPASSWQTLAHSALNGKDSRVEPRLVRRYRSSDPLRAQHQTGILCECHTVGRTLHHANQIVAIPSDPMPGRFTSSRGK
jgi:hypothetical protein